MKLTATVELMPCAVYISRGSRRDKFYRNELRRDERETYSLKFSIDETGKLPRGGTRRQREIARQALHDAGVQGF